MITGREIIDHRGHRESKKNEVLLNPCVSVAQIFYRMYLLRS